MKLNRILVAGTFALGAAIGVFCWRAAPLQAAPKNRPNPPISIRDVQTVWHRRATGNAYFSQRLRAELVSQGLRFVPNAASADAILDSDGQYTARGFVGKMVLRDRAGRILWSENVFRPSNSGVMAYQRLAQSLRAQRR